MTAASAVGPTVSIVIPCFNYEGYIGLAIASALAQGTPAIEVIVVDDGSTDGSATVIESFGDRIRSFRQRNQGHVAAFNRGFAMSAGDIVIFLDADDLLHPDAVRSVAEAWRPGCAKVQYNLDVIDAGGERLGREFCTFPASYDSAAVRDEFRRTNTYLWPVCTGNAYGRAFLEQTMPLTVRMAPDGLLNTVAPLFGDVVTLPQSLGAYRIHAANQSNHGSLSGAAEDRFVKQISLRREEESALRLAAAGRGVALVAVDLLDQELAFINYRLMLQKLGRSYSRSEVDTAAGLWRRGLAYLTDRPLPVGFRSKNFLWMTVLALAPRAMARWLVNLRFNRGQLLLGVRGIRTSVSRMLRGAA